MADVHVHRPIKRRRFATIQFFHQLIPRHNPPCRPHQGLQNIELKGCHFHRCALAQNVARPRVNANPVHFQFAARITLFQPPQDRFHARHQLTRVKRLRQVIVRAEFQTDDPVLILATRRQHHNGQARFPPDAL